MTRLIDADKLKFVPALIAPVLVGDEEHWETIILKDRIDNAPTVDAVPVVHGKWVKSGRWGRVYRCDQCGNYLDFDGVNVGRGDANYCPNCGADMRGEQDG